MKINRIIAVAIIGSVVLSGCTISLGRPRVTPTADVSAATQAPDLSVETPEMDTAVEEPTIEPTIEPGAVPEAEATPTEAAVGDEATATAAAEEPTPTVAAETDSELTPLPTDIKTVVMRVTLNLRSGPGLSYKVIGQYRARRTAEVNGVSADGKWYRVLCLNGETGDCWVTADTRYVIARK